MKWYLTHGIENSWSKRRWGLIVVCESALSHYVIGLVLPCDKKSQKPGRELFMKAWHMIVNTKCTAKASKLFAVNAAEGHGILGLPLHQPALSSFLLPLVEPTVHILLEGLLRGPWTLVWWWWWTCRDRECSDRECSDCARDGGCRGNGCAQLLWLWCACGNWMAVLGVFPASCGICRHPVWPTPLAIPACHGLQGTIGFASDWYVMSPVLHPPSLWMKGKFLGGIGRN